MNNTFNNNEGNSNYNNSNCLYDQILEVHVDFVILKKVVISRFISKRAAHVC